MHVVSSTLCKNTRNGFLGYLGVHSCQRLTIPHPQRCHLFAILAKGHAEEERGLRRRDVLSLPAGEPLGNTRAAYLAEGCGLAP